MPIYYTAPRLQRMNKNASETMCFDGSGAASGATVCGAGNTLDEWGCANGAENADCLAELAVRHSTRACSARAPQTPTALIPAGAGLGTSHAVRVRCTCRGSDSVTNGRLA